MGVEFEWDAAKAVTNLQRHGVTLDQDAAACGDPFAVERIDDRENYGEERMNLIGMCGGRVLHVTYTERDGRIRIISARQAERHEREGYFRENAP